MRRIVQLPKALERSRRAIVLCALIPALLAAAAPTWGAEPSPWQGGHYRDFVPETATSGAGGGVVARSLGPAIRLTQTAVQRPRLAPGEFASLRAQYTVIAPRGPVDVKETRVVRFNGAVLATLTKVVSRSGGPAGSEYRLKIPSNAAEGWYTVTTLVEAAQPLTRSISTEQANATFYVQTGAAKAPAGAAPAPAPEGPRAEDDSVKIKLWADKPQYKVGETLRLSFETNRDAYVTLVNVGTSGALTILFPNRFSGGNAVNANRAYTIPGPDDNYELTLGGPAGTELIYALVTLKPVQFIETDFSRTREVFRAVTGNAVAFTRDINALAKKTPLKEQAKAALDLEVAQ